MTILQVLTCNEPRRPSNTTSNFDGCLRRLWAQLLPPDSMKNVKKEEKYDLLHNVLFTPTEPQKDPVLHFHDVHNTFLSNIHTRARTPTLFMPLDRGHVGTSS